MMRASLRSHDGVWSSLTVLKRYRSSCGYLPVPVNLPGTLGLLLSLPPQGGEDLKEVLPVHHAECSPFRCVPWGPTNSVSLGEPVGGAGLGSHWDCQGAPWYHRCLEVWDFSGLCLKAPLWKLPTLTVLSLSFYLQAKLFTVFLSLQRCLRD